VGDGVQRGGGHSGGGDAMTTIKRPEISKGGVSQQRTAATNALGKNGSDNMKKR